MNTNTELTKESVKPEIILDLSGSMDVPGFIPEHQVQDMGSFNIIKRDRPVPVTTKTNTTNNG